MNIPGTTNRKLPYVWSGQQTTALRERIRSNTTAREPAPAHSRHPVVRICLATTAVAALVVAGCLLLTESRRSAGESPQPDLEQMLSTAAAQTIRQAAAENYDAIIYNQQL